MTKANRKYKGKKSNPRGGAGTDHSASRRSRAKEILYLTACTLLRETDKRKDVPLRKEELLEDWKAALDSIPDEVACEADPEESDEFYYIMVGEVFTRWRRLNGYTLNGQPRPLPARGRVSLTSLIRAIIDDWFDNQFIDKASLMRTLPGKLIDRLMKMGRVEFKDGLYAPNGRFLELWEGTNQKQRKHHATVLRLVLRTIEGNARRIPQWRRTEKMSVAYMSETARTRAEIKLDNTKRAFLDVVDDTFLRSSQNDRGGKKRLAGICLISVDGRRLPALRAASSAGKGGFRR